jgi:uroporphyrinogen-III synthase
MQSTPRGAVWVTRAQPGAAATAERLSALGLTPLVAPLIATRPLPLDAHVLAGAGAFAVTSAEGARRLAAAVPDRTLPVFAVGDATAAVARAEGFADVRSADGAGVDLARLIAAAAPAGCVVHVGAAEPAFDLAAALTRAGVTARPVAAYETVAVSALDPAVAGALDRGEVSAVLVHSPAAARALATRAGARLRHVAIIALSEACAAPLQALRSTAPHVAARPTEAALITALVAALGDALGKPGARS